MDDSPSLPHSTPCAPLSPSTVVARDGFPDQTVWPQGYVLTDVRMKAVDARRPSVDLPRTASPHAALREVSAAPRKRPRRQLKVSATTLLEQQVDASMEQLDSQQVITPTALLYITQGSITAAHCLERIRQMSDEQWGQVGDPWLHLTPSEWANYLMINQEDWVQARALLRRLELISERSVWNHQHQVIVVEVSFDFDGFCKARRQMREVFKQHFIKLRRSEASAAPKDKAVSPPKVPGGSPKRS